MGTYWLAFAGVSSFLAVELIQTLTDIEFSHLVWAEWFAWGCLVLLCSLSQMYSRTRYDVLEDQEMEMGQKSEAMGTDEQPSRIWSSAVWLSPTTLIAVALIGGEWILDFADEKIWWTLPLVTLATLGATVAWAPSISNLGTLDAAHVLSGGATGSLWPVVFYVAVSLICSGIIAATSSGITIASVPTGCGFLVMSAASYFLIGKQASSLGRAPSTILVLFDPVLRQVSVTAFALWTLYFALLSSVPVELHFVTAVLGVVRVVQVLVLWMLCQQGATLTATTVNVAAIAITRSLDSVTQTHIIIASIAFVGSILQTVTTLSKSSAGRNWLYLLLLLPLLSIMNSSGVLPIVPIKNAVSSVIPNDRVHPIERLWNAGQKEFADMKSRQSKTLDDAVREYRRRYGRRPPPHFDVWFEVAQQEDYVLIDEFDSIMASLEPFWGISPATLQRRVHEMPLAPKLSMFSINGTETAHDPPHYHTGAIRGWFRSTASQWPRMLPDMRFWVDCFDEPRVNVPYDAVDAALENAATQRSSIDGASPVLAPGNTEVKWLNIGRQTAWESMLASCHVDSPSRNGIVDSEQQSVFKQLKFISNQTAAEDICGSALLHDQHGFFKAPNSLSITKHLVPIFAQARPSIFNDILYPSPFYTLRMDAEAAAEAAAATDEDVQEGDDDEVEIPWEEKMDRLYWAGTANGGYSTMKNWREMQRQRMVILTSNRSAESATLLKRTGALGLWKAYERPWKSISSYFYLKISRTTLCERTACEEQDAYFQPSPDPKEYSLGSKYAIDIDGNSFSGRYYRLLKSGCAVLKQTVFKEWHDGRLVPWAHFIPVSMGAEELGEIMRFLIEEEEGRRIGKRIGDDSREWSNSVLRKVDLELTFLRLLMEYARIMSEDRNDLYYQ